MATAIKHKQRSRRVWKNQEPARKWFFNICNVYSLGVIQNKMFKSV